MAIHRFPRLLCGSWSATPEGPRANAFLDAGGDVLDPDEMWQPMLDTLLAWGCAGRWASVERHMCKERSGKLRLELNAAMSGTASATLDAQLCDNHPSKSFGSGGSDSGLQACDVDALMHETHGFGHLATKPVMNFLGVSELGRALSHDGLSTDLKRSNRASVFWGGVRSFSKWRLACNDAATSQGACRDVFSKC